VGSGQWAVGSGQWAVGGGQWAVGSGQWAEVKNNEGLKMLSPCIIFYKHITTADCPLQTANY